MKKAKVAVVGTGNIGADLMVKIQNSPYLECSIFAGHNPDSVGIKFAQKMGVPTTFDSIQYLVANPDCCDIVCDCTSAKVHAYHAPIIKNLGKFAIDLTPANIGGFCVPVINLEEMLTHDNVNMVTCGGQAVVPIAKAVSDAHPDTRYMEIVATISSKSAGPGTRANIDEFTQTTRDALTQFTGVTNAKAIIILNPAEPPITMRNTLYAIIENPDLEKIRQHVFAMEKRIQEYVPGYSVIVGPLLENGRVTTSVQVIGSGAYLPSYSGNLDIITCAAAKVAEEYAKRM